MIVASGFLHLSPTTAHSMSTISCVRWANWIDSIRTIVKRMQGTAYCEWPIRVAPELRRAHVFKVHEANHRSSLQPWSILRPQIPIPHSALPTRTPSTNSCRISQEKVQEGRPRGFCFDNPRAQDATCQRLVYCRIPAVDASEPRAEFFAGRNSMISKMKTDDLLSYLFRWDWWTAR